MFCFYKDHSNPLLKDLKLLKLRDVLESEIIKTFYKFSRNEVAKSVCSIFNLVHEVHTRNKHNNLLIYNPRTSTSRYGSHSLRCDGASLCMYVCMYAGKCHLKYCFYRFYSCSNYYL